MRPHPHREEYIYNRDRRNSDLHAGSGEDGRLAERTQNPQCCHGIDGRVLEARLERTEAGKRGFALVLVNPQHIEALPGRKTDQQDAERIATYLLEGLLRGSLVPPPVRELRELTRRSTHLQGDRNRVINRIGRLLETANIKLGSVLSNIVGQSGRAILTPSWPTKGQPGIWLLIRPVVSGTLARSSNWRWKAVTAITCDGCSASCSTNWIMSTVEHSWICASAGWWSHTPI
ncbi:MAG TPA: transposase [Terriglobales bacterium]|nr:transposase [Terriglobales bacterium]